MWELSEPHQTLNVPVDEHAVITVRRHGNPDGPRVVMSHGNGLAIDLYSSNSSSWQDIAGATSSSYTGGADDVGSYLRASVAYSDRRGSNKTASAVTGGRIGELRPSGNADPTFADAEVPRS